MMMTSPGKFKYPTDDPAVRAATKAVAVTQIDGLDTKVPIGPTQLIPIAQVDQPITSFTGAGTVFARIVPIDLSGNEAAAPFFSPVNIGLPPVTGFALVPGEAKWTV